MAKLGSALKDLTGLHCACGRTWENVLEPKLNTSLLFIIIIKFPYLEKDDPSRLGWSKD